MKSALVLFLAIAVTVQGFSTVHDSSTLARLQSDEEADTPANSTAVEDIMKDLGTSLSKRFAKPLSSLLLDYSLICIER